MMKMKVILLIVVMAVLAGPALAAIVGPYRLVFITSMDAGSPFQDIADYNAHVQDLADMAGIGFGSGLTDDGNTDWFVLGSTSIVDARDNTNTNPTLPNDALGNGTGVPIYLVDGVTKVVDDNADLWDGDVDHIINQDEYGTAKTHWPHTGTYIDGTVADPSNPAQSNQSNGRGLDDLVNIAQGNGGSTTDWIWRQWTQRPPSEQLPLYAMSEVIPEPATMCLLGLGGLVMLRRRR